MIRPLAWGLGVVLAAAIAGGVYSLRDRRTATGPRLVLLYAPCTVNRNYLAPYNSAVAYTPALDAFARDAVVFTKHHTEEGQSGIAYAALFSGNQAMRHGVYYHPTPLSDSVYTIAEAYRDNGYETFFWAYHPMASPELNFAQGVDPANTFSVEARRDASGIDHFLRGDDPRFLQILARLRDDPTYRAFVLTDFSISHAPYKSDDLEAFCGAYPHECQGVSEADRRKYSRLFSESMNGWEHAFERTAAQYSLTPDDTAQLVRVVELLYESNIWRLDRLFAAVLEAIKTHGLLDQSLIAFTADHGEVLYRTNAPVKWWHGFSLLPDDIEIPLIIRSPGLAPGRFDAVTRSIDVFPTLAALSGIRLPAATTMGVNLAAAPRGESSPPELLAFMHTSLAPLFEDSTVFPVIAARFPTLNPQVLWVAVREGNLVYKLTSEDGATFQPHVYDWESDADETTDLYDPHNEHHLAMIKRLAEYKSALIDGYGYWKAIAEGRLPTERQKELLRSLGYIQ